MESQGPQQNTEFIQFINGKKLISIWPDGLKLEKSRERWVSICLLVALKQKYKIGHFKK